MLHKTIERNDIVMANSKEERSNRKSFCGFHVLVVIIGILSLITTVIGVFYTTGGEAFDVANIYGKTIKMWGDGIYKYDSYFKAPLSRGTDLSMLLVSIPILILALLQDIRKATMKTRVFLLSLVGIFIYYAASYSLGVAYNLLFLVYIAMLTCSLLALIMGMRSINLKEFQNNLGESIPFKGIYIFSIISSVALFVAWLPDIIGSILAGSTLQIIDTYTTEITYVIDMGLLSPLFIAAIYLMVKKDALGYLSFLILSMICILMAPVLILQSVFQTVAGIETPLPVLITKIGIFILLALWAIYLQIRLYKNMK